MPALVREEEIYYIDCSMNDTYGWHFIAPLMDFDKLEASVKERFQITLYWGFDPDLFFGFVPLECNRSAKPLARELADFIDGWCDALASIRSKPPNPDDI